MIQLTEITPIKLPGLSSIKIEFNYAKEIVDTVKQIPNAIYHKKLQCWEIPTTSLARAIELLTNYDTLNLNFLPDISKKEILMIGDQLFTDIWGGNRFNINTLLVKRINKKEIWISRIKRPIERIILNHYYKKEENSQKCRV